MRCSYLHLLWIDVDILHRNRIYKCDDLVSCFMVCSRGLNWISYSGIYYSTVKMCFSNIIVINMTNDVGELRQPNKGVYKDIEVHKRQLYT